MKHTVQIKLLLILKLCLSVKCIVFSVPHQLARLFILEEEIIELIEESEIDETVTGDYLELWEARYNELKPNKELNMTEEDYFDEVLEKLVGNPVHVYSLIDRLVYHLSDITFIDEIFKFDIDELIENVEMPDESDVEGATQALVRIQFAYRLDPALIAVGNIYGTKTSARLTTDQMMDIARDRFTGDQPIRPTITKEYALSIIWAEAAYSLETNAENKEDIELFLNTVRMEHNNNWQSPSGHKGNLPNEMFFVRRIEFSPKLTTGLELRSEEDEFIRNQTKPPFLNQGFDIHDFYSLCRGDPLPHSCTPHNAQCHVTTRGQPYFTLAPVKVETICNEPTLLVFHDILTSREIKFMKSKVLKQLTVATVQDESVKSGDGKKVSNERTQSSGWLWDQEYELLWKLSRKTGLFTGLIVASETWQVPYRILESEAWQMGLYGSGGHYLPHFDAFEKHIMPPDVSIGDLWVGNRIATVMFYLSDLVGGFTAFPAMGVAARPSEGSAVFWFNTDLGVGNRDPRAIHGACPAALGIKWVSNKWIREGVQIWSKPCPA